MTDKNYEILEHIAVLSENASGWRKELTLTKWFDNEPKLISVTGAATMASAAKASRLVMMSLMCLWNVSQN